MEHKISLFHSNKSVGPNSQPTKSFEDLKKEVSNPLTIHINTSFSFGIFPLKFGKIILVFLKIHHLEYNNFGTISLNAGKTELLISSDLKIK